MTDKKTDRKTVLVLEDPLAFATKVADAIVRQARATGGPHLGDHGSWLVGAISGRLCEALEAAAGEQKIGVELEARLGQAGGPVVGTGTLTLHPAAPMSARIGVRLDAIPLGGSFWLVPHVPPVS